jgi:hypothetical protein
MIRSPLYVEHTVINLWPSFQQLNQVNEGSLGCIALIAEHGLPCEQPVYLDSIEAANQIPLNRSRLDRMCEAETM